VLNAYNVSTWTVHLKQNWALHYYIHPLYGMIKTVGVGTLKGTPYLQWPSVSRRRMRLKERKTDGNDGKKEKAKKREAEGNGKETVSFLD
jgi:hypothetical protein